MPNSEFMFRNPSVNVHRFAMIPRADIPRSMFKMEHTHKTTINASALYPVFVDEVLPGDSVTLSMTAFCRMDTPVAPVMDNMRLESFFFFIPNRLVWSHWVKFMGEQDNPGDSISYAIPQIISPAGGYGIGRIGDYFGLPTVGSPIGGNSISHSALPMRCYNLVFHQWFRDENLMPATWVVGTSDGDGPDLATPLGPQEIPYLRGKRHDYFTSCLPWTEKNGTPISIPLNGNATVRTSSSVLVGGTQIGMGLSSVTGGTPPNGVAIGVSGVGGPPAMPQSLGEVNITGAPFTATDSYYPTNLYADLSTATSATINALRLAFQTQKLLERDARGGTRYTEIVRSHFGVLSPDSRLQRAEYLGGGLTPVNISPVAQTSATGVTGGTTPQGYLGAVGTILTRGHGFRYSSTEHGHILGLVCITADLTYQYGVRRMWFRSTRYDFYFPVFAALGEQAVLNQEIYCQGTVADPDVFGYQERWAEYRYFPSLISGQFRSSSATPLDFWHLSQSFSALPTLNTNFIQDGLFAVLDRVLAAGAVARENSEQFLCDFFFSMRKARPMPTYSVPGLIDHF